MLTLVQQLFAFRCLRRVTGTNWSRSSSRPLGFWRASFGQILDQPKASAEASLPPCLT